MSRKEWIYAIFSIVALGICVYYLPWYMPLFTSGLLAYLLAPRRRVITLFSLLAGAGWYACSAYQADQLNDQLLSSRMSALFGDIGVSGLIILTAFIGFLMVFVGGMLGKSVISLKNEPKPDI